MMLTCRVWYMAGIVWPPRTAQKKEIIKAYRKLAQQWHPDNFQDPEEKKKAEKKFIDIAQAKEVLTDPGKPLVTWPVPGIVSLGFSFVCWLFISNRFIHTVTDYWVWIFFFSFEMPSFVVLMLVLVSHAWKDFHRWGIQYKYVNAFADGEGRVRLEFKRN